jgi:hypothetical protein
MSIFGNGIVTWIATTTLSKLTRKFGTELVHELNRLLVQHAPEQKLVRCRKLRIDTTVVQAPIRTEVQRAVL